MRGTSPTVREGSINDFWALRNGRANAPGMWPPLLSGDFDGSKL